MIAYRPLYDFMRKRHDIYLARKQMPSRPETWTKDPILRTYKFTNVYRELDRVTVWVRKHIREPYAEHPYLWFMLCIARQINHTDTLLELKNSQYTWPYNGQWDWRRSMQLLRKRARHGQQVYTGAYILNANGKGHPKLTEKEVAAFDKPLMTCKLVLGDVWDDRELVAEELTPARDWQPSMRKTVELLCNYHGWGGFLAYEVACDLRYTRYLQNAPDITTWAHAGPGAKRGLARLLGYGIDKRAYGMKSDVSLGHMRDLLDKIDDKWPTGPDWPKLEMREIEHSLCEFDKYERVRTGQGRPRSKFTPNMEPPL